MTKKEKSREIENLILSMCRELKRAVADWEIVDRWGTDKNTTNPVFTCTREMFERGILVQSPVKVPGRLINGKRRFVEAYGLPEFVPNGITFHKERSDILAKKFEIFATALGNAIERSLTYHLNLHDIKTGDRPLTMADLKMTNEDYVQWSKNLIARLLQSKHASDVVFAIERLPGFQQLAEQMIVDDLLPPVPTQTNETKS